MPRLPIAALRFPLALLVCLLAPAAALGEFEEPPDEPEAPLLRPRARPRREPSPEERGRLEPQRVRLPSRWTAPGLSLLAHTPLVKENTFDTRFASYGLDGLFSGKIATVGSVGYLHVESGLGLTFSRYVLPPGGQTFSHVYLRFPLRLRLLMPLGRGKFAAEAIGGAQWRFAEYDSRPTTDGGLFFARDVFAHIDPNIGLGLLYSASPGVRVRVCLEYLNFAVGVEFQV